MESLLMATQVVLPMAIMVGIGVLLRICNVADAPTMKKVDNMIFKVFMPTLSFYNIYKTDFSKLNNMGYIIFGVAGLTILFLLAMTVGMKYIHPRSTAGAYGQAVFRSNYLIFGAAIAESIYGVGNIGIVTLLGAVAVPLYNAQSAVLLETARHGNASAKKLLLAIAKNPTVIATILGLAVNFSGMIIPDLGMKVIKDLSGLTTPLSFLSIGVSLSIGGTIVKKGYLISASLLRLMIVPAVFMAAAVLLGFRGQELCALLILFAAPTAVSSYPMAVAMEADGDFAGQMVAYTTIFCLPTIFLWTLLLNSFALL